MKIFIMRHGNAEPMIHGHTDKHRQLTTEGEQQVKRIAGWMKQHHYFPELVIASPFKRTRQTAELIHHQLGIINPIEYEDCLISGSEPDEVIDLVNALEISSVLLVSHMPLVADLTTTLAPASMVSGFSPATIAKVRYDKEAKYGVMLANIAPTEV